MPLFRGERPPEEYYDNNPIGSRNHLALILVMLGATLGPTAFGKVVSVFENGAEAINDRIEEHARGEVRPPQPPRWRIPGSATGAAEAASPTTYTVRAGDTLAGIAALYGTTVDALADKNGILNPDRIYTGQVLKLP